MLSISRRYSTFQLNSSIYIYFSLAQQIYHFLVKKTIRFYVGFFYIIFEFNVQLVFFRIYHVGA